MTDKDQTAIWEEFNKIFEAGGSFQKTMKAAQDAVEAGVAASTQPDLVLDALLRIEKKLDLALAQKQCVCGAQ